MLEHKHHRKQQKIRAISERAVHGLGLKKALSNLTMRILSDANRVTMKANSTHSKMAKDLNATSMRLENGTVEWVWNMYRKSVIICDWVIIEKARRVQNEYSATILPSSRTNLKFSR